jgi:hypothetical protein
MAFGFATRPIATRPRDAARATPPLLDARLKLLRPILDGLVASRRGTTGVDRLVLYWCSENAHAAERFVRRVAGTAE